MKSLIISIKSVCFVLVFAAGLNAQNYHPMHPKNEKFIWAKIKHSTKKAESFQKISSVPVLNYYEIYNWNGEAFDLGAKREFTYSHGLVTEAEYFLLEEGNIWNPYTKQVYTYSGENVLSFTNLEIDFTIDEYVPVSQYAYGYTNIDGQNKLTSIIYREYDGGWIPINKTDLTYSENQISGGIEYEWTGAEYLESAKFDVSEKNDSVTISYWYQEQQNWFESYREVYPGISKQELFDLFLFISNDPFFEISFLSSAFPDFNYAEKSGEIWKELERQTTSNYYQIFTGKLLKKEIEYSFFEEDWVVYNVKDIWFNESSEEDSVIFKVFVDGSFHPIASEIYSYNSVNLLEEINGSINYGEGLVFDTRTVLTWDNTSTDKEYEPIIDTFQLLPAYPNPFNPQTNIQYRIDQPGMVKISVYDISGRLVKEINEGFRASGTYISTLHATGLSSGRYFVQLNHGNMKKTISVTLIK